MLCLPALVEAEVRGNAEGKALFALKDVSAVAGADRVDGVVLRELADVTLLGVTVTGSMGAFDPVFAAADGVQDGLADAGHNVHVADDVDGVRDFQAVLGERGADRAHGIRNDVHGLTLVAVFDDAVQEFIGLVRGHPVVEGAGLLTGRGADEGPAFHTGNVRGVGAVKVAVRKFFLIEFDEFAGGDRFGFQGLNLLTGTVNPDNFVGA